jgi:hypothetical protein
VLTPCCNEPLGASSQFLRLRSAAPELHRYLRHDVALYICFHGIIVKTRCSATGVMGRHAAVALMTGCEALLTMYRGSSKLEGRDRKREWTVLLEAISGLGIGLTDMVSTCKHLQYRKQ